jgi:hypothetical protein
MLNCLHRARLRELQLPAFTQLHILPDQAGGATVPVPMPALKFREPEMTGIPEEIPERLLPVRSDVAQGMPSASFSHGQCFLYCPEVIWIESRVIRHRIFLSVSMRFQTDRQQPKVLFIRTSCSLFG